MVGNSKSAPTFVGVQWPGRSPRGTNITPKRISGLAADCAIGVNAGTIDSRNGNATAAPIPRNMVRRERLFFIVNICVLLKVLGRDRLHPLLKRRTLYNPQDQRRKTIILLRRVAHDRANRRHVVITETPAKGI